MMTRRFAQRRSLIFAFLGLILAASAAFAVSKLQTQSAREAVLDSPPVTNMGLSVLWP